MRHAKKSQIQILNSKSISQKMAEKNQENEILTKGNY